MTARLLDGMGEFRGIMGMMDTLPGEAEAGERLKQTALRGFGPIPEDHEPWGPSYKLTLSQDDAPVPSLFKYALTLIGLRAGGGRASGKGRLVGQLLLPGRVVRTGAREVRREALLTHAET